MNRRWLAIVNPHAGMLRHHVLGPRFLDELAARVDRVTFTSGPGDATHIAAAASDYDGLVAVGGDGTVAEVLSGMAHTSQRLAVLPGGTGNCLAIDLGVESAASALRAISEGVPRTIDLMETRLRHSDGSVSSRWLASTAGLGYAAEVALLAKRHFSRLHGYAYAAAAPFVRPRKRTIQLASDCIAGTAVQLSGLLINNTRHIGSVQPFPAAEIDDGLLDVFLFQSGWIRQCLHDFEMVTGCPVYGTPQPRRCKQLRLHCDPPETVMLDGELCGRVTDMELVCRPAAVTCMGAPRCSA